MSYAVATDIQNTDNFICMQNIVDKLHKWQLYVVQFFNIADTS